MRRRLAFFGLLTAGMLAVNLAVPTAASPADSSPKIEKIPAWSHDLPIGKAEYHPKAVEPKGATADKTGVYKIYPWKCSVYASDPWQVGRSVGGEGSQICSGSGYLQTLLQVTIQRYLGLGFWQNVRGPVSTGYTNKYWLDMTLYYNCSGTGSEEYRVISDGYAVYGRYHLAVQSQTYWRFIC